jgi:hypothetical protein
MNRAHSVHASTYLVPMVSFEFGSIAFDLDDRQATTVAERLRNNGRHNLPDDDDLVARLSGDPEWADGALALADWIEDVLVGCYSGPIPLEGKAAVAMHWTLRVMQGLGGGGHETAGITALRDALVAWQAAA